MNIESVVNGLVSEMAMIIAGCYSNEGVMKEYRNESTV